ncbi:MAG TPA: alanine--glyoxylate aminotransferase family protein [Gemmatimonadaceae bacterium]|nr:alanine--glyoxylate aminotransferase family protein [Gemmatimonadaceae bacterium]
MSAAPPKTTTETVPAFGTFFLPGPTEVRAEVLAAMTRPMIAHRGKAFEALFERVQEGLRLVFGTKRPVFISTSSATGLMEAAVRCAPVGPVLSVVNGAFSERFANIARACGRDVTVLDVPAGETASPDHVTRMLRAGRYAVVTVVHSETSTGALTDVRAISDAAHAEGVTCLVDGVTSIGATPLFADEWGLDFVLTGSQKGLAMPPGLAFAVASERYMSTAALAPNRGLYFDLVEFEAYARKHQTANTPAISLFYALEAQLAHIARETMEGRWARHRAMAERTHGWVGEQASLGVGVLARAGARSHTVTAVTLPSGITGGDVVKAVGARGFVVGGGYGAVRDRTFRIGHMGDHTLAGLERCLAVCGEALEELVGGRR